MAGDWIKIEHIIHEKPEVLHISQITGIDVFGVVGRLVRVWSWYDAHTTDGCCAFVAHARNKMSTDAQLDALTCCAGFASAMREVGWLTDAGSLPNFDVHNGKTAKRRAKAAISMQKSRCANVARARNKTSTREEKRREYNPPKPPLAGQGGGPPRRPRRMTRLEANLERLRRLGEDEARRMREAEGRDRSTGGGSP